MTPTCSRGHRRSGASLLAALALVAWSAAAGAQAPPHSGGFGPESAADARALALTPAQRIAIYQSVTKTQKNSTAPIGFRAAVGARVPATVELKPLSATLAQLVPQAKDLRIGMVDKQVILVDPHAGKVVAVVTQEPANAVH